ncbi:MAG: hypothetical protein ACK56I_30380, partial [bacterium]
GFAPHAGEIGGCPKGVFNRLREHATLLTCRAASRSLLVSTATRPRLDQNRTIMSSIRKEWRLGLRKSTFWCCGRPFSLPFPGPASPFPATRSPPWRGRRSVFVDVQFVHDAVDEGRQQDRRGAEEQQAGEEGVEGGKDLSGVGG